MILPRIVLALMLVFGGIWLIQQDTRRIGAPHLITWGALLLLASLGQRGPGVLFELGAALGSALRHGVPRRALPRHNIRQHFHESSRKRFQRTDSNARIAEQSIP